MPNQRVLLLTFYLGKRQYALPGIAVKEVVSFITPQQVPHAPAYVAGLLRHDNRVVPVIDLRQLIDDKPCRIRMSTRIILVYYPSPENPEHLLGFIAERVTDTTHKTDDDLMASGIDVDDAPYLGAVFEDLTGLIRCIVIEKVLPDELKQNLFSGKSV